ncbi:MAG: glycosyltransferase [Planctomycetes bacterium]|nr:glycosyltransferase [Planctomycetota bacterium]
MRVALVTTPPSVRSGIGDYTRAWLAEFRRHADVEVFVDRGAGEELCGLPTRPTSELARFDGERIVYQLGNELSHAFMTPLVARFGGTVVLHDWVLFDQAVAAFPELARGGLAGHLRAFREGGLDQAMVYAANRARKRRDERGEPELARSGTILDGWHAPENGGRWTNARAFVRVPGRVEAVRLRVFGESGRELVVEHQHTREACVAFGSGRDATLEFALDALDPVLSLRVRGIRASDEQRRHGDTRTLGVFVRSLVARSGGEWRELDLAARAELGSPPCTLDRDRFRLPFNRSIVAHADAFLVHSDFVRRKILAVRADSPPIAVVHHGARPHWRDDDRREMRRALGLAPDYVDGFLVTSFGHVQAHKRIDRLLAAFALLAEERPHARLALVGSLQPEHFDAERCVRELGLEGRVRLTGYVDEELGRKWIHAGDLAVQLRGPSTGGSSGGVFQSLALGRGVIATDLDEQAELPGSCVLKVKPGEREVPELARVLVRLCDAPAERARLEAAARRFVEHDCAWSTVARKAYEFVRNLPGSRATRPTSRA